MVFIGLEIGAFRTSPKLSMCTETAESLLISLLILIYLSLRLNSHNFPRFRISSLTSRILWFHQLVTLLPSARDVTNDLGTSEKFLNFIKTLEYALTPGLGNSRSNKSKWVSKRVCVCVCEREREREKEEIGGRDFFSLWNHWSWNLKKFWNPTWPWEFENSRWK